VGHSESCYQRLEEGTLPVSGDPDNTIAIVRQVPHPIAILTLNHVVALEKAEGHGVLFGDYVYWVWDWFRAHQIDTDDILDFSIRGRNHHLTDFGARQTVRARQAE
jgi:hypothetical protein